jgi:ubiquinone/menaquinone biosynthesis C-methylase UbiE
MANYEQIKSHWDSLSDITESYKASWDDFYMLQKEITEICKYIQGNEEICDIGCNNGYCDLKLLALFKGIKIVGLDYSEKLISQAQDGLEKSDFNTRAEFRVGNILDPQSFPDKKFDIILIKRVLINLNNENDQIQALINVKKLLKENGKIILTEAVEENWERLNRLRQEFGLDELKQPWHNKYLNDNVIKSLYTHFNVECDDDYSSSYYIFSRVLHPWIKKVNGEKKLEYLSEFNRMASSIPNFGDYGSQRLFILSLKVVPI